MFNKTEYDKEYYKKNKDKIDQKNKNIIKNTEMNCYKDVKNIVSYITKTKEEY